MSKLSYLEKLLDGVEVEWLPLGNVTKYEQPTKYLVKAKDYHDTFSIPVLTAGKTFILGYTDETHGIYEASKTPVIIFDDFTTASKWVDFDFKAKSSAMKMITSSDDIRFSLKYVYYWLNTLPSELVDGDHKRQWISNYAQKKVPVPCPANPEKSLAIQAEIVRILDKFTELTAELTAELTLRKKQYNYYRDKLLSFEECEVEWKTLDEVASFRRGSFPQPYGNSEWYNGEGCMPFVQVADVADFGFRLHRSTKQQISKLAQSKSVFVEAGTVIVSLQGTIGRVALTQYDCYVDRTLAIFTKYKAAVNKKYFAHQLKAKFDLEKEFARGSTLKTITKEEFSKFQIPIPPLEVQNRIVALLDKFDRLTHSIEEGLPRELELRQKQYEYYRELLFSFPKLEAASN
ncbi:restriction endonuclease [Enterobacter hormaechei subsp. steigerwaltii]|uniref:restriction endonuclease subunit S n=1 Tax=Enterobacteriaceae TaxID=543 RepID=UPI00064A8174|nr:MULTISPECIES: restriction endonuclease subunit S [Enterobacter cloacae complex]EEJ4193965.1 restriction endonuclease subunit S [Salmonella enterica subsp. enterica serovar Mbandaka]MCE1425685.1 restriction endonuclease subunit S [Enterobacter hormaechei]HEE9836018.1 restriction endonuclease subunit S [Citrobacter freundii]KLR08500.1 restriction endonuclease [Enterobacter hormaechei subsp. steigerwaltii]MBW7624624.1 restriction endonuclease subunit S [Enterobacter kobei]